MSEFYYLLSIRALRFKFLFHPRKCILHLTNIKRALRFIRTWFLNTSCPVINDIIWSVYRYVCCQVSSYTESFPRVRLCVISPTLIRKRSTLLSTYSYDRISTLKQRIGDIYFHRPSVTGACGRFGLVETPWARVWAESDQEKPHPSHITPIPAMFNPHLPRFARLLRYGPASGRISHCAAVVCYASKSYNIQQPNMRLLSPSRFGRLWKNLQAVQSSPGLSMISQVERRGYTIKRWCTLF